MSHMLVLQNDGEKLKSTNFWESQEASWGLFFLSWQDGTGRLLIPDTRLAVLRDMRAARTVTVSRGRVPDGWEIRDALDLLFEDDTPASYVIRLGIEQTDRMPAEQRQNEGIVITAWTRCGYQGRWPGRYRVVEQLPDLMPLTNP